MKKTHALSWVVLLAAMLVSPPANADVLTPQEALARAIASTNAPSKVKSLGTKAVSKPRFTQLDARQQPAVYLFDVDNADGGFLLVSADDVAPALLGYGDRSVSETEELNPQFSWWIEEYGRQIQWARENGVTDRQCVATSNFPPIAPMLKTKWNQSEPYNNLCPTVGGERCVTGCVATAISQIMSYHQWPETGEGSNTYTPENVGRPLTVNFANTKFDWANMLNTYTSSATAQQQNAVATLMYNVGVGVNMNYSPSGSGAYDINAELALTNYFRYQPGISYIQRNYYPINQWEELVYDQLSNGPLYYSGISNTVGHAFVCDGYNGSGYFHINWGWGGVSDGYFLLAALDPPSQGIGGSTSGYNFYQGILSNVKPLKPGNQNQEIIPFFRSDDFTINEESTTLGSLINITLGMYNYTAPSYMGTFGMKLTDSSGNVSYIIFGYLPELPVNYGYTYLNVYLPDVLASGTYAIYPVIGDGDGNWYDVGLANGIAYTNKMTVSGNRVTFSTSSRAELTANNLTALTPFYVDSNFALSFTIENNSDADYTGSISAAFVNTGTNSAVAFGANYPIYLAAGESTVVDAYSSTWDRQPAAGEYELLLIDDEYHIISDRIPVTIKAATPTSITIDNLRHIDETLKPGSNGIYKIPADQLKFKADVRCNTGYLAQTFSLHIFPYIPGQTVYSIKSYSSQAVYLEGGESDVLTFDCPFEEGEVGSIYFCEIYGPSGWTANQIAFELAEPIATGVAEPAIEDEVVAVEYFNLGGVKVDRENLTPGYYIVRSTTSTGVVTTSKQIVRKNNIYQ